LEKYTVIDSAYLRCSFNLTYLKDTLKPNEKSTDLQILLIGQNISKYYSQYALEYNHFVVDYVKNHDAYPSPENKGQWTYEVFKNYPQGKETITDVASMLQGNYLYEEELPVFDWKITGERQTILSYNCQKAVTSFRGRDFIAWFTTEIPIPNGPWKFGGLHGLILKLHDSEENFVYQCEGLEQLKNKEPIKFYKIEYTKLSRNDLNKLYFRFHDNFVTFIRAHYGSSVKDDLVIKLPYNPIERE
jgi:GLPGLI family protein